MFERQPHLRERGRLWILFVLSGFILVGCPYVAGTASAQEIPEDADTEVLIGDLGISSLEGEFRLTQAKGQAPVFDFRSEPYIHAVDPEGPSGGKLRPGDTVVAIDGHLITTQEGGRLFGNPPAGEPVELTIRRGKRESTVTIVPVLVPVSDAGPIAGMLERALPVPRISLPGLVLDPLMDSDIPVEVPLAPSVDLALPPAQIPPVGRLGFGLSCENCMIHRDPETDSYIWQFEDPPKVYRVVSGGPAFEAGLRSGDKLTHIDGIPLDSEQGGLRFSTLEPGDSVTWTVRRRWKSRDVTMTVDSPPKPEAAALTSPPPPPEPVAPEDESSLLESEPYHLRYSGSMGSVRIEVRSADRVSVSTRDAVEGEEGQPEKVTIVTGDSVIEIWDEPEE
jgi:hypothetical protein